MRTQCILAAVILGLAFSSAVAQDRPAPPSGQGPPQQAFDDCMGKKAGEAVEHTTREGVVAATCVETPQGLAARPNDGGNKQQRPRRDPDSGQKPAGENAKPRGERAKPAGENVSRYSLEQATSDRAQLHTIAFDGLAFLTGDFGYDTFLPPGKVSDYFGFQYMRDIDAAEGGHNTSFLTKIAENMLAILNSEQKAKLVALARAQQQDIRRFAEMRLPLIKAFRQNLEGQVPAGSGGLSKHAVIKYSAELYALDGQLSYDRAKVMGEIIRSLSEEQKSALSKLKFGDSRTWTEVSEHDKRGMPHEINVAVMTYASEMFAWYAGSIDADTYFCPERHGMYFGGFGMKTAPAMGKKNYSISTKLTSNSGEAFLDVLDDSQRGVVTQIIDSQRQDLREIVSIRRSIATELRKFQSGGSSDLNRVLTLSKRYGELDGEMSYMYATAFAKVGRTLTSEQKEQLASMRHNDPNDPRGPFLYSSPIGSPKIGDTSRFFGAQ